MVPGRSPIASARKKASRIEVKAWLEDAIYLQTESLESWWEEFGPGSVMEDDDDDDDDDWD